MPRILVIEDEPDIQTLLRFNLEREGHAVVVASSGEDGLHELRRQPFDLVLLDLMLPDRDGLEICKVMRAKETLATIPIIMVTAKGDESDVVIGLSLGADDYVTKPFRVKELMARIKARLQRTRDGAADAERKRIQVRGLVIDPVRHRVAVDEVAVPVTLTEFRLLHFLASHAGVAYGRYDLLDNVGGDGDAVTDRTVDVHIRNLRGKIKPYDDLIETVRGIGYRFSETASS
ncbi:MAG: response regulator [Planctomycetes bacterium]|nr:response regulator [Planctomycetota bacterium]